MVYFFSGRMVSNLGSKPTMSGLFRPVPTCALLYIIDRFLKIKFLHKSLNIASMFLTQNMECIADG